jgi:NAD+ synthase (glutamine-hydrolysing)
MPAVRLGLAQMNATVGALTANAQRIGSLRERARALGVDLLVTPELALTGYPPEDLLLKEGFLAAARTSLDRLAADASGPATVVGVPLSGDGSPALAPPGDARDVEREGPTRPARVANALAVLAGGAVAAVATKRLLPNYDVFDEQRYFAPGVGPLTLVQLGEVAVGLLVCEDVWVDDGPAAELARAGAGLLVVANASPFARGRRLEREEMLSRRARETGCAIAYVNLVGGQDELVFDGQSFVVDAGGTVLARAAAFDEELLVLDVEARAGRAPVALATAPGPREPARATLAEPPGPVEEVYRALVVGTRDYLAKNGFSSAAVNLSGGIDSSLVAVVAADAIGARHVAAFALPSRYSSAHSLDDAVELARRTGIALTTLGIEDAHRALAATLAPAIGEPGGLTDENLQSRIRGLLLMAISNATGAIALTTGNKSELATGYFTLYGDSVGGFAVIKDVPKTLVYELCRWRNEAAAARGEEPPIPEHVLVKAPSAELRPDQRDDQSLPPYEALDPLLELYVEGDATAAQLIAAGHDPELVRRVVRLVDASEYKRRQMPPGVRVTRKAFGRDRRMPITNAFTADPT